MDKGEIKKIISVVVTNLLLVTGCFAYQRHAQEWTGATFIGPFINNEAIKYYIEPQIRFSDDQYKLKEAFLIVGIGYQFNKDLFVSIGQTFNTTTQLNGVSRQEYRIWQQLLATLHLTPSVIINRTRLEERKNLSHAAILWLLRERCMLRIPFKKWPQHAAVLYDELFLHLNHPRWASPRFYSQNRFFVGIGTSLNKAASVDIGYLNQLFFSTENQLNNVLLIMFNINM